METGSVLIIQNNDIAIATNLFTCIIVIFYLIHKLSTVNQKVATVGSQQLQRVSYMVAIISS